MARISSSVGLVSGIDSKSIIDQLIALEGQQKSIIQTRIDTATRRKNAYSDLISRLGTLKDFGNTFNRPSTFQAASTNSSDENVISATASNGAAIGSYQFQVARLVTTQQSISNGFSDYNTTSVGAGTITIEQGGGELNSQTLLSELRGNNGVRHGQFRITDRAGNTSVIDTTASVSLDDVIKKINTSLDVSVRASISGDKIKLTDTSGKTSSNFIIQDLGDGHTAEDLGIVANTTSTSVTGAGINYISRNTLLDQVNDARGVRTSGDPAKADFRVTVSDGSTIDVTLNGARSVGDILDKINAAGGSKLKADIPAGSNGIRLVDSAGGLGTLSISALNGSKAVDDLGINKTASASTITGSRILAGIDTVLLSSLRGGTGMPLGQISLTDRSGASATVNLSGATSVQDVLDRINASGIGIQASLKSSQNGIALTDTTGASGNVAVADVGAGTSAAVMGLVGTFDTGKSTIDGANLQRQWITENSLLSSFGGGKGVAKGSIRITNSAGTSKIVDLSNASVAKLSDVIAKINDNTVGIKAGINANGDGLLITDTTTGANKLKIEEIDSTTANDLNILGTAAATTIDGSFEKTVTISATDKLSDVQGKINALGYGVSASVINDGTTSAPFRLSLNARNTGRAGRVVFDGGTTAIRASTLVESQDAAVFMGGSGSAQPLLITSSRNQLANVIPGVTIDLHGTSSAPVTLNVTRSADDAVTKIGSFVTTFNDLVGKIDDLTAYNVDTKSRGLLLGDSTAQDIQTRVYGTITTVVNTGGKYRLFADVGLTIGDGAKLVFDEAKFRSAFADDPATVSKLFNLTETQTVDSTTNPPKTKVVNRGLAGVMVDTLTKLIDPVDGEVIQQNKTIDDTVQGFQDRITKMDALLADKRTRLEKQFANLESTLAQLQGQQSALNSFTGISNTSTTTKK